MKGEKWREGRRRRSGPTHLETADERRGDDTREMRKVAARGKTWAQRGGWEGAGEGRGRRAEVCPLADGQLVAGRVAGHGDLCLRLQRALSLFTLLLKETAGAPPTPRLHSIIRGDVNEVNVRWDVSCVLLVETKDILSKIRRLVLEKPEYHLFPRDYSSFVELNCFKLSVVLNIIIKGLLWEYFRIRNITLWHYVWIWPSMDSGVHRKILE